MSDEEIRFRRSQGGHDANDLHNHGGQDGAREDRTEREDLEEEIEELDEAERVEVKTSKKIDVFDDDVELPVDPADIEPEVDPEDPIEEKKIAEAKKAEETAEAEEAIEDAIETDKEAEAPEVEPIMKIDSVEEPKAKSGAGWKVATILFALLAIAGCGAAAYLFLFDGTTKFLGREVSSKVAGAQTPAPTAPEAPNTTPIAEKFDFDAKTIDYAGFTKLFESKKQTVSPIKIDITKDGKYYYIIADVVDGVGGYAGVWYRETKKGAEWTKLQAGHTIPTCNYFTDEQKLFAHDYGYIDDDLNSKYVGCEEIYTQAN